MVNRCGPAAGSAPYPGHSQVTTPLPDGAEMNGITFHNADGTFELNGQRHTLNELLLCRVENGVLSIVPGKYGHIHHEEDGSTTFFRYDGETWLIGHVEAKPVPVITRKTDAEETPAPKETLTLLYSWRDYKFEDRQLGFQAHEGGASEFLRLALPASRPLDITHNGWRIQRAEGSAVLCLSNDAVRYVFKYCPVKGWYQIKTAMWKVETVNDLFERIAWGPWAKAVILVICVATFGGAIFFLGGTLWRLFFHPGRLHLPKRFFDDDVADYFDAAEVHKIVEAYRDPFGWEEEEAPVERKPR